MKKLIKGLAAMTLVLAIVMSVMGCGKKEEVTVIDWYLPKAIDNIDRQMAVEKEINEIIEPKIGARVSLHLIDMGNYDEKMNVLISSGEEFDICFTSGWLNDFSLNAGRGAFLPLDDLLNQYGQNILAKSDPRALDAAKRNGQIMAIPGQGAYSPSIGFVFKKDLVDKYNIDYKNINSLEELVPYLELLKANEPDMIPLSRDIPANNRYPYTDIGIMGVRYNEETGDLVCYLDAETLVDEYRLRYDFYQKGYFSADVLVKTDKMAEKKTGRYAVMGNTGVYTEDGSKSTSAYGFDCVESYMYNSMLTSDSFYSAMNAISVTSDAPEKCMQLLDLIWSDDYLLNTLAYGIEGVDYVVDESSTPENKKVIPNSGKEQKWAIWHNWLGPLFDQWDSSWNSKEALMEMEKNNHKGQASNTLGFTFDTSNLKTEIAQISSIISEVEDVFITGTMSDFDEYVAQTKKRLKDAGIDKVIKEAEKQLDEFMKNKA